MNEVHGPLKVVVVGAGVAGASCARALAAQGHQVQVLEKSRGAGGRLATRHLTWVDAQGLAHDARFDHGAPGFAAAHPAFQNFAEDAVRAGWLRRWLPHLCSRGLGVDSDAPLYLPWPDMQQLCVQLLRGVTTHWHAQVEGLRRTAQGWQVHTVDQPEPRAFDAVVLAMPPAQAARLLLAHRRDWAQRATIALMQPCWTLMGVANLPQQRLDWNAARPTLGPLAWLHRNETRPGRENPTHQTHWVAHARPAWSREHLEDNADAVQTQMQSALSAWLGEAVQWHHATVHRWRYARPHALRAQSGQCWWDACLRLGVCGDFLGGGGVEGAWLSATALAQAMQAGADPQNKPSSSVHELARSSTQHPAHHAARLTMPLKRVA
jgi:renalase